MPLVKRVVISGEAYRAASILLEERACRCCTGRPRVSFSLPAAHSIVLPSPQTGCVLVNEGPVPRPHGGNVAVIAKDTQGAGVEQEMLPGARGQPDPARNEHTQHVTVREHRHTARSGARSGDHP